MDPAEALENTTERIDLVGYKLAQLGERAIELLLLIALAFVTVVVLWLLALEVGDPSADIRLDQQVEFERAAQGPDLLDEEVPRE
jgi:hypothetical protein